MYRLTRLTRVLDEIGEGVDDTELKPFRGVVALDIHHCAASQRHLVNLKANQSAESSMEGVTTQLPITTHLQVRQTRVQVDTPVDEPVCAIQQTLPMKLAESLLDSCTQVLVACQSLLSSRRLADTPRP